MPDDFCHLITDNGSYRPEATLSLRRLAAELGETLGHRVEPVSLLHSTKIDPVKLDGMPAQIFEPFLKRQIEAGRRRFVVSPLFFGPSAAIVEYLPQRVAALQETVPELEVTVAPCIVDLEEPGDLRMAKILAELIERAGASNGSAVALVDHGTPRRAVTDVRNLLARQLGEVLGDSVACVRPCSMERRAGPEYEYNEPLLENLLGSEGFDGEVLVSMLFLSPGRHAGPGGDVAEICKAAEARCHGLRTQMTELVATHPGLIELLEGRYREAVGK